MSENELSFVDLVIAGHARPEDIDDFVDRWHDEPSRQELATYLGMTRQEYEVWVVRPDQLVDLIRARQQPKNSRIPA